VQIVLLVGTMQQVIKTKIIFCRMLSTLLFFVDMGKQYALPVKNKFLCRVIVFAMVMTVTFCSILLLGLWFSG